MGLVNLGCERYNMLVLYKLLKHFMHLLVFFPKALSFWSEISQKMKENHTFIKKNSLGLYRYFFCLVLILFSFSIKIFAQFGPQIPISESAPRPNDVATFDIDGDGDQDVLVISFNDNTLGWHENMGNQIFSEFKLISNKVYGGKSIYPADLDGDGLMDVLCASRDDNKISWFKNLGEGIFDNQQIITSNFGPGELVYSADLDNDGDMDVVSSHGYFNDQFNTVVFINNGSGSFSTGQVLSNQAVYSLSIGDIDNDDDLDIILRFPQKLSVCKNVGNNTFEDPEDLFLYSSSSGYTSPYHILDLNANEAADILVEIDENYLGWYENQGDLTFSLVDTVGFYHGQLKRYFLSDKDGDGDLDVFVQTQLSDDIDTFQYHFGWYENNGDSFEDFQIVYAETSYSPRYYFGDLTNDGSEELIVGRTMGSFQSLVWFHNLGGESFGPEQAISNGVSPINVVSGDLDGDGIIDILCSTHEDRLVIYKGLGNLNYAPRAFLTDEEIIDHIDIGDLDNDGDLDIVGRREGEFSRKLIWIENLGDMNFGPPNEIISLYPVGDWKVKIYDINNDGHNDIVYSQDEGSYNFRWIENSGGGQFNSNPINITISSSDIEEIHPADFDNDGDVDILTQVEFASQSNIGYFENTNGQFEYISLTNSAAYFHPFDLNEDGYLDILAARTETDQIVWQENLTDGTFSDEQVVIDNLETAKISHAADFDNDGDLDILTMSRAPDISSQFELSLYEKQDDQTYIEKQVIDVMRSVGGVSAKDLDNDGDLDILTYSAGLRVVSAHENYEYNRAILNGQLFYDLNQNAIFDSTDLGFELVGVSASPESDYSFTTLDGGFGFDLTDNPGIYTIHPESLAGWSLTTDSTSFTIAVDTLDILTYDSLYFGFYPDSVFTVLKPELTGGFPRCNSLVNYWIDIENQGTSIPSGMIQLEIDEDISYVSSIIEPDSISGQSIFWHFDSLTCYNSEILTVQVEMPDFNSIGDTLTSVLSVVESNSEGEILYTKSDTLAQVLVCAYDPNDKAVTPKGIDSVGYIALEQDLEYLIRFQNTGNDTALTVIIRDQLDPSLNFTSVNPISSSHQPMHVNVDQNGEVEFIFENIMLPDSNVDFLGSQGFVKFSVSQIPDLLPNTPIENTAEIYFDYNPPVITNTTLNTIECHTLPIPAVSYNSPYLEAGVEGEFSYQWYLDGEEIEGAIGETLMPLNDGYYYVSVTDIYDCTETSNEFNYFVTTTNLPTLHICENDSLSIFGNYEFESGIFVDSLISLQGFDSLVYQELVVHDNNYLEFEFQACSGDSILIGDAYYFVATQIVDSLQSVYGCDSVVVNEIEFFDLPEVTLAPFDFDTVCVNHPPYELPEGLPSGGNYIGSGVINGNFNPESVGEGFYTIYYTYSNEFGCQGADSTSITVELCLSTVDQLTDLGLKVYPNPTEGEIVFQKKVKSGRDFDISIFDSNSKLIANQIFLRNKDRLVIDISKEASGIYFVHIFLDSEKHVLKLIKR